MAIEEGWLRNLRAGAGGAASPDALIAVLVTFGAAAEEAWTFARRWQASVPRAAFVGIELSYAAGRPDVAALRQDIVTASAERAVQLSQTIVLGAGEPGRLGLDIVLQGVVPALGVIGLDIAPGPVPSRIAHCAALVRLVHHRAGEHAPPSFRALVEAMQLRDMDVRTTLLPDIAQATPDVTHRAGATFLAELVATAGHLTLATRR